jgi:hypothetical protein
MDNNTSIRDFINEYIETMNEKEKIAFNIAKSHLGSSFDIEKCIGFIKFYEKKVKSKK